MAAPGLSQAVVAGHEVVITQAQRGGQNATHIDLAAACKEHAVGVAKKHLAVGVELAVDLTGLVTNDAVERHCAAAGLHKVDAGGAANVEALPVQRSALGVLLYGQYIGRLADAGAAGHHLAAGGQACNVKRPTGGGDKGQSQRQAGAHRARACLTT